MQKPGTKPVVACVIQRRGKYLLCRRAARKRHAGLWEFPGGKLRRGESIEDAAARELSEELRLKVTGVGTTLQRTRDPGSPYVVRFVEVEARGEPRALEHSGLAWARPTDLPTFRLAPADRRFATTVGDPGSERLAESYAIAHAELGRCLAAWRLTDARFTPGIRIVFSRRMTRCLGIAYYETCRLHLSHRLAVSRREELLREVVCHEAAHLAAPVRYPRGVKHHGPEWRGLMNEAGYEARVTFPAR